VVADPTSHIEETKAVSPLRQEAFEVCIQALPTIGETRLVRVLTLHFIGGSELVRLLGMSKY
jgi:hypothetical protein